MLIRVQLGRESSNEGKGSGQVPGERVAAPSGGACGTSWDTSGKRGVRDWCHSPLHHGP